MLLPFPNPFLVFHGQIFSRIELRKWTLILGCDDWNCWWWWSGVEVRIYRGVRSLEGGILERRMLWVNRRFRVEIHVKCEVFRAVDVELSRWRLIWVLGRGLCFQFGGLRKFGIWTWWNELHMIKFWVMQLELGFLEVDLTTICYLLPSFFSVDILAFFSCFLILSFSLFTALFSLSFHLSAYWMIYFL